MCIFIIGTKKDTKNYQIWSKECNYWSVSRMWYYWQDLYHRSSWSRKSKMPKM